ncbi:proteasome activator complex subunit 4 [Ciona intestinalis]
MDMECSIEERNLGFVPQRENLYNDHLPYTNQHDLDTESNTAFEVVKNNLVNAVLLRDLRPGVTYWTNKLTRYIRLYGLKFSKEDHILLVKLFYEILSIPELEFIVVDHVCSILKKLLKKRELLDRNDLVLEWRPLHRICEKYLFSKMEPMGLEWFSVMDGKLRGLVRCCRSYFPPNVTQEMLEEWRPLLCLFDVTMGKASQFLDWFLPTLTFTEEERKVSWMLWKDEFLSLFESVRNGPMWEQHYVKLFARLAHNNIGHIDWGPFVEILFTRLLRTFQLPVGKLQHTTALSSGLPFEAAASWIISMMGGENTKKVLQNLKLLFDCTETYFHPSNYGKWSPNLLNFMFSLAVKFANRIHRERYKTKFWEPKIPESHLITDDIITEFVMILKPVTLMSLYSKLASISSPRILQILAYLRPELIMPSLVEKTYVALNTLTEPHQVRACLSALSFSLQPGIKGYPECRQHVIPLLFQCLPGLDPNDLPKSAVTFQFIHTVMTLVPAVDCSSSVDRFPSLTEEERELCYATAQFEDFLLQFFDRCFILLEALNQDNEHQSQLQDGDHKSTEVENVSEMLLVTATSIVLQQASKEIYTLCIKKFFQFSTTHLYEGKTARSSTSTMIAAAAKVHPEISFPIFIPHFASEIMKSFEDNPESIKDEKVDKQVLWDLTILSELCRCGAVELLKYRDQLYEVARKCLSMKSRQGYLLGAKILNLSICSWASFHTNDRRNVGYDHDPEENLVLREWGATSNPSNIAIKWHVPSEEELEAAFCCAEEFLLPQLEELQKFNSDQAELDKDELLGKLEIIKDLFSGSSYLMPVDTSDVVDVQPDSQVSFKSWKVTTLEALPAYHVVLNCGDRRNLRHRIFTTVRETLLKIRQSREDDVKSICMIINIYSLCAVMHELPKATFDHQWKAFVAYKAMIRDPLRQDKKRSRISLIDRVSLQHMMRLLAVERAVYTRMNHQIMMDLLDLSVSHYMKVRVNAQGLFFHGLLLLPTFTYKHYLQPILSALENTPQHNHQQLKGGLYLLLGKSKSQQFFGCFQRWDVMEKVWPALISAPHSEKPSITKMYIKLATKIQASFKTIAIESKMTDSCTQAALNVMKWTSSDVAEVVSEGEVYEKKMNAMNLQLYNSLVNKLIVMFHSSELTWKYMELVTGMLSLMLRYDVHLPLEGVDLFLKLLVDDSLALRDLSIACVASLMKQMKREHKVRKMTWEEVSGDVRDSESFGKVPGDRPDNLCIQYNTDDLPDTKEKFEKLNFIDKTHWGYYCWPTKVKTYAPFNEQPSLDRTDNMSTSEQAVYNKFTNESFVEKFVNFLCLENEKGKDKFDPKRVDLFRGLFRNFGDSFLPLFKTHIQRLSLEKRESYNRCCAEIVAGIVMGSKHWDFMRLEKMWMWLIPALRDAVANISPETMRDWDKAFANMVQNRDPRRIHWLIDFLVSEPAQASTSALVESSKLYVLQGGIHQQEWRVPQLLQKILSLVEPMIGHPYKSLRNRIGSVLASVFLFDLEVGGEKQLVSRTPRVSDFMDRILPRLEILLSEETPPLSNVASESSAGSFSGETDEEINLSAPLAPAIIEQIQSGLRAMLPPGSPVPEISSIRDQLNTDALIGSSPLLQKFKRAMKKSGSPNIQLDDSLTMSVDADSVKSEAVRVFKTVMKWVVSAQRSTLQPFKTPLLKLLPLICKMYPVDRQGVDEELHRNILMSMSCIAQCIVPPEHLNLITSSIEMISTSKSWHARHSILPYIQVFVYNNLFSVTRNESCVKRIRDVVLHLLEDERLEVSKMSLVTLSGLLQCRVIQMDDELLTLAFKKCKTKLEKKSPTTDSQKSILRRHAGVLILSACVLSSPYTVPDWMPRLVMKLADHLHDPQPIQGSIKSTLSDFRRTHHDNWHDDKQKFTSDELAILTDLLVSPSYYA